jgi:histidyl-tRNA synthetase
MRGTQDIIPPEVYKWQYVEKTFFETFENYGYSSIRTPIFEGTDLFRRAVGEDTDITTKEMYTFTDRGGRSITLRPENTASVVRAYLENGMHRIGGIVRLYYAGPMFRYEKPQAGRYRQFHQVGLEAIGSMNPALDVEVIDVVMSALEELGFEGLVVKLNSVGCRKCRSSYRGKLIEALKGLTGDLCEDCRERMERNPLRVFDCKRCIEVKGRLPTISANLCGECGDHFERVTMGLESLGRSFDRDEQLVRGLDYYTKTTFEIVHGSLGAQNALCGGGRYDDLVEECGGPPTPAVGFSAGLERIVSVLPPESAALREAERGPDFYVVCLDEEASVRALELTRELRRAGRAVVDFSLRALKRQLKSAERSGARIAVIVDSSLPGKVRCKELASREQVEIPDADLGAYASGVASGGKE